MTTMGTKTSSGNIYGKVSSWKPVDYHIEKTAEDRSKNAEKKMDQYISQTFLSSSFKNSSKSSFLP
jgi:hypothetical protein